jgi:bacterioferritin (cytochrome b1)
MATADFEMRQLLRAYRKGLISDGLLEEQMKEITSQQSFVCNGKSHTNEREMVMHCLDEYRCAETFGAEYFSRWLEVSDQECVKGGLRTIQQREAFHAQLLEARLRELGGSPQCTMLAEQREQELAFYAAPEKKDIEKLQKLAALIQDPTRLLKPLTDVIDQIQEDQQSKELLRTIIDDEMSSIKWLQEACETLSAAKVA